MKKVREGASYKQGSCHFAGKGARRSGEQRVEQQVECHLARQVDAEVEDEDDEKKRK